MLFLPIIDNRQNERKQVTGRNKREIEHETADLL
jgi:hypothetical protein